MRQTYVHDLVYSYEYYLTPGNGADVYLELETRQGVYRRKSRQTDKTTDKRIATSTRHQPSHTHRAFASPRLVQITSIRQALTRQYLHYVAFTQRGGMA